MLADAVRTAGAFASPPFAAAAWLQHRGYQRGDVTTGGLVFSIAGFVALTTGGWLGGAIVFVHGVRVLASDESSPTSRRETWNG